MFETVLELLAANTALIGWTAVTVVSTYVVGSAVMKCKREKKQSVQPDFQATSLAKEIVEQELQATLLELEFVTTTPVSLGGAKLAGPHWTLGMPKANPAVFLMTEAPRATLRATVQIDRSVRQPPQGKLSATLGDCLLECTDCPLSAGTHVVEVRVVGLPNAIGHLRGNPGWTLASEVSTCSLGSTALELFVILAKPGRAFKKDFVWIEALRFLCEKVQLAGIDQAQEATERITAYCHTEHNLTYHSANHYTYHTEGQRFSLAAYMAASDKKANCYDQAGAVQVFSHAVGSLVSYQYASVFGYINTTVLLGGAECNNPGFQAEQSEPIVDVGSENRTGFCDHAFCMLDGKVFDACVGPQLGTLSLDDYLKQIIDNSKDASRLLRLGREGHPAANATREDVSEGGIVELDRGGAGQVVRRHLSTAIVEAGYRDRLIELVNDYHVLNVKGPHSNFVSLIEHELEVLLVRWMDQAEEANAETAVSTLSIQKIYVLGLDALNRHCNTVILMDQIDEVRERRLQQEVNGVALKDEKARTKQIGDRKMVIEMELMTAAEFDQNEVAMGRTVFPYDK